MDSSDPVFVIPTYRLKDVGKTVELYDENFHTHDRKMQIWVFDDSTDATHKKYYPHLENTSTFNEVYYIGSEEKAKFVDHLIKRTGITVADYIIYRMFRPSYGGNRNFTVAYTLGRQFISSDDDMMPGGYILRGDSELAEYEIMRAETSEDTSTAEWKEYDIAGAFLDILGRSPETLGMECGEYVEDPSYDLVTNSLKELQPADKSSSTTTLYLKPLVSPLNKARIKLAQSFRTGTSDVDSIELLHYFLSSDRADFTELRNSFFIRAFRPVITKKGYRFDCGVSGYDNETGLPPFFPTNLRFEDYSFRLWASNHPSIASAHVNSVQHHTRSSYMRPPLAAEIYNEIVANFLKGRISETLEKVDDHNFIYTYDGVIEQKEVSRILDQVRGVDALVEEVRCKDRNERRKETLGMFQYRLRDLFKGYDHDLFMSDFSRHIDDQNYAIKDCMVYWPRILEISSWLAKTRGLPMRKVKNKRK